MDSIGWDLNRTAYRGRPDLRSTETQKYGRFRNLSKTTGFRRLLPDWSNSGQTFSADPPWFAMNHHRHSLFSQLARSLARIHTQHRTSLSITLTTLITDTYGQLNPFVLHEDILDHVWLETSDLDDKTIQTSRTHNIILLTRQGQ